MSSVRAPAVDDPLQASAQYIKGVGPARFELLQRLGLETVGDLLFYFPRSYEDLSDFRAIADVTPGKLQTVAGEVVEIEGRELRRGRTLVSVVLSDDGSHVLEGIWFNQPYMGQKFRYGQRVLFSGKPEWHRDHWQMSNPRVQYLADEQFDPAERGAVIPVYGLTEGLRAEQMRRIVRNVVQAHAPRVPDLLPVDLLKQHRLPGMGQALHDIHLPASIDAAKDARRRLVYEEFLILQVALAVKRRDVRDHRRAPPLPLSKTIDAHIRRLFPFTLTQDQDDAIAAICKDMASDRPMQRLLQADVGAGKTAVAVYALLLAVAHKHQAALMAPTEVLARQHWRTLSEYLARSRVRRQLLTGGLTSKERKIALGEIKMGQVDLVVGTQAIIQEDVRFNKLGLVVIDEQHRFGVSQRERIRKMGEEPHYLVMTATPIPRTVALSVFGDLDVSIIRELPPGRKPVVTRWVPEEQRPRLEAHLCRELAKGRQLYVVCPLVEEPERGRPARSAGGSSDAAGTAALQDIKAAEQTFEQLRSGPLKDFQLGLLHGRMDERDKDRVMLAFRQRQLDALVSTSVIEVGVDVPNATLMVIERADRFGLSQLHQLRGRVSRGPVAGECYIFTNVTTEEAKQRLRLFVRIRDGFTLAEKDLELRGIGEFFGTRQHGLGELRIGNLISDADLLTLARKDAFALVAADPRLSRPEHSGLRSAVLKRYGKTLDLAKIG